MDSLRLYRILPALVLALVQPLLLAQEATPTPEPVRNIWRARMPAGDFLVRLSSVSSISRHEYLVDGVGKVSEVTIAMEGSAIARFYFLEPAVPQASGGVGQSVLNVMQEKAQEAVQRTGAGEALAQVVKNYPAATHAHTIEYRVASRAVLEKLFSSLEDAWLTGSGGAFTP